jgi:3-dehydroquinate dehydratase / shikimate dehydrogenase
VLQAVFSIDWSAFSRMSVFGQGVARICAVVAAPTIGEFKRLLRAALGETPTVELRLDWLESDLERLKALQWLERSAFKKAVLIATCRRRAGGGKFNGNAEKELFWLRKAKEAGCLWCDLEVETLRELPQKKVDGCGLPRVLLSIHDFNRTPPLSKWREIAERSGADALKIAALSRSLSDSERLVELTHRTQNVVAVPMGEVGLPARILALRQGSALLYAPLAAETAPGQVGLHEMKDLYRAHKLTKETRVFGVIGDPIRHSLSPLLHNTGYLAAKKDAVFVPFLVEHLSEFLKVTRDFGIRGFSVTIPHKEKIFDYLDACEPLAEEIGAVNTVTINGNGKLAGSNTDYVGVLRSLGDKLKIRGSRVLIFGAGGAARAAAFALAKGGAQVSICARRENAAKRLARAVHGDTLRGAQLKKEKFDAILNTTPVGMHPHEESSPLKGNELNCGLVLDLIYRPLQTELLKMAEARGIQAISGVEMFLEQGIAQWELWMGTRAPRALMRAAILKALRREEAEKR